MFGSVSSLIRRFGRVMLLAVVIAGAVIAGRTTVMHAEGIGRTAQPTAYLPLVQSGSFSSEPGDPNDPGDPGDPGDPQPIRYTFFADPAWKTSNADVAVDKSGVIHVAYYYYEAQIDGRPTSAVYRFCSTGCDKPQNWQEAKLLDGVNEVQLAVTSTGKPRLLVRTERDSTNNGDEYYYGECNQGCANASNWAFALVNVTGETALWKLQDDDQPQRSFALDNQDRPRFVQIDRNYFNIEPDRYGTFYMYCDSACTDPANWREVQVGNFNGSTLYEMFEYPALTFTGDGRPRIVAAFTAIGEEDPALYYVSCDAACGDVDSWDRVKLWARGQGQAPGWDVAVDAQDRPRIAFYPEALDDSSGEQLYYAWCDQGCLQAGNWQKLNFGLGQGHGGDPDLVMENGSQPRIAFVVGEGDGIGIMACDSGCNDLANWKDFLMDSWQELEADWNVPYAPTCVGGLWSGMTPALVFDAKGNLRLVYDAAYHAKCWWDTDHQEWIESYQFYLVQRSVRGILVLQP